MKACPFMSSYKGYDENPPHGVYHKAVHFKAPCMGSDCELFNEGTGFCSLKKRFAEDKPKG
jgi:hypothetical protein